MCRALQCMGYGYNLLFSQNEISTDKNGNYIILAHEDERLLFSKVGYVTQKQDIQSRKQISIQIVKGE